VESEEERRKRLSITVATTPLLKAANIHDSNLDFRLKSIFKEIAKSGRNSNGLRPLLRNQKHFFYQLPAEGVAACFLA
jgi:hypothetical protein